MATRKKMTMLVFAALLGGACGGKGEASQKEEHAEGEHAEGEHAHGEKGEHAEGEKGEHAEGEKDEHTEGEEGEHGEGVVELTPEQLASARLAFGMVEQRSAAGLLRATAQIEAAGQRQARLGPRVAGRVAAIKVSLGQEVKKGAVLAVVDSPELGRATADYLGAIAQAKVARETADREKALFDKKISSEKDWREAEAAAVSRRAEKEAAEGRLHALGVSDRSLPTRVDGHYGSRVSITSPIDGIVVESSATLGQMVESTDTLFTVMDLREVWVVMDVYERDLAQVGIGQQATALVGAYPDRKFVGKIENVGAIVEAKSRAVKVRVVLPNADGALKPGMFADVTVEGTTGEARDALLVPSAAVQREGDESLVFVARGQRDFEAREIEVGRAVGEWVEVVKGVSAGEKVVTTGAFLLKSELKKAKLGGGHSH